MARAGKNEKDVSHYPFKGRSKRGVSKKNPNSPPGSPDNPFKAAQLKNVESTRPSKLELRFWVQDGREDPKDQRTWTTHSRVFSTVTRIRRRQSVQRQMDLYHACLYDDIEMGGFGPGTYGSVAFEPSMLAFNIVRQNVDTLTARIARSRPLPTPITNGREWSMQRRAKKLGRWFEGIFEKCEVYRKSSAAARDAGLFGNGFLHPGRVKDKIFVDRVYKWEIIVDHRDGYYGAPRTLYFRRWVDRLQLIDQFPEFADEIETAQNEDTDEFDMGYDDTHDQVLVIGAWHLKSGDNSNDGAWALCLSNVTLARGAWKHDYFPFPKMSFTEPLMGYFSTGIAKLLTGLQYTINDMAEKVQEQQQMSGTFILVPDGSNIETGHLDNGTGTVINHAPGLPPQFVPQQPGHPDQWNFVQALLPWGSNMSGVSQLSSQSQKPAGITAARALEALEDQESGRFALFERSYDQLHIDLAWMLFDLAKEIIEEGGSIEAGGVRKVGNTRFLDKVDFKKLTLAREDFSLEVWPTSILPKSVEGKTEIVDQWVKNGWIQASDAPALLEFPDFERAMNMNQSAYNTIQFVLDRITDPDNDPADPDTYITPDPQWNLALADLCAQQFYNNGIVEGLDDDRMKLLQDFRKDCQALLKQGAPANANQAPPGAPSALAGGGPAPAMAPSAPVAAPPPMPGPVPVAA